MPADGRINVAGLNEANLGRFVEGVLPYLFDRNNSIPLSARSQELSA
jgi:aromatic-amino-acid transaminase